MEVAGCLSNPRSDHAERGPAVGLHLGPPAWSRPVHDLVLSGRTRRGSRFLPEPHPDLYLDGLTVADRERAKLLAGPARRIDRKHDVRARALAGEGEVERRRIGAAARVRVVDRHEARAGARELLLREELLARVRQ